MQMSVLQLHISYNSFMSALAVIYSESTVDDIDLDFKNSDVQVFAHL